MDTKELEVWRPVSNTGGQYEVSNYGHVRTNNRRPGLLTLTKQVSGYLYAMVCLTSGKQQNCRVNRLVAKAFIPNPYNLPEVNHIDGNKENNHVSNLEWVSRSYNVKHSFSSGLKRAHRWTDEERKRISEKVKATLEAKHQRGEVNTPPTDFF